MSNKTSLVLEGGGLRGAYTAGALTWLIDNDVHFDNGYGISTGAGYLVNYLLENKKNLFDFSIECVADKRVVFAPAILRCGKIVDYDYLYDHIITKERHFDMSDIKNAKMNGFIGLYDLELGKTIYVPVQTSDLDTLKASTSLPILGKTVTVNGRKMLDGGITEMIPIKQSIEDGCNRHLIIATKPQGYVRKPAKKPIIKLMKALYPKYPQLYKDYNVRHLNYVDQIGIIKDLENKGDALYIYPSKPSKVTRLSGSREDLIDLFNLGYSDMENRKDEIFRLLDKNV